MEFGSRDFYTVLRPQTDVDLIMELISSAWLSEKWNPQQLNAEQEKNLGFARALTNAGCCRMPSQEVYNNLAKSDY